MSANLFMPIWFLIGGTACAYFRRVELVNGPRGLTKPSDHNRPICYFLILIFGPVSWLVFATIWLMVYFQGDDNG